MAMIICNECGKEISDKAEKCPNCGCPIIVNKAKKQEKIKKKNSTLSIWAAVLGLFTITAFIGGILAVIDLSKKDKTKRHIGSGFAIFMCIAQLLVFFNGTGKTDDPQENSSETAVIEQKETQEIKSTAESEPVVDETEENIIEKGGTFDKDGLKITLNDCSTDFTDYEDEYGMLKPKDGYKYAMASFTYENTGTDGDSDKYVSIYDFECYADGAFCEQTYVLDDSGFMNANLSPGRNVSFKTYYLVPIDCKEIELEYTANYWTNKKIIVKIK